MLDLKPEYLKIVKEILLAYVPNSTVWAYGSRVNGHAHEGSDLDLVVINPQDSTVSHKNISALREAFSESNLPILVDVVDWAQIPGEFQEEIKQCNEEIL
jgi:predicted nucleotidyltransferase